MLCGAVASGIVAGYTGQPEAMIINGGVFLALNMFVGVDHPDWEGIEHC